MALGRLQVTDFRCLQSASVEFDPRYTLISGVNASGKTSLLEAIYVLGRGRSFRTTHLDHAIRRGTDQFVLFGEIETPHRRVPMGVEGSYKGLKAKVGGAKPSTLAELALYLPLQIIDPEVHHLIDEGPSRRRKFLDYGTFHVDQSFVGYWQRYQQVLKQRNAALKARQSRQAVAIWDADLLTYGEAINAARKNYVDMLATQVAAVGRRLLGMEVGLSYRSGWVKELGMATALANSWTSDLESGMTQVGPHRADLIVRLDDLAVKDRISRGQQKLLAAALLMSQLELFPPSGIQPTLLLDDPAAELDDDKLEALIQEVSNQKVQLIVTTLHSEFAAFGTPGRRFGLSNGRIRACEVPRGT